MRFTEQGLNELISPLLVSLGYELWGIELSNQGKYSKLRIYVEKERGMNVEDCALASGYISDLLSADDLGPENYTLEVSSPGLDRVLFNETQYSKHLGEAVNVSLFSMFDNQRQFAGLLKGLEDDCVVVAVGGEEYLFPYENIKKMRLVPDFDIDKVDK